MESQVNHTNVVDLDIKNGVFVDKFKERRDMFLFFILI